MSRIIVKQLPKKIDENELRNIFGAKGTITDISMKYTPEGKFRQFCFIGYQTEAEAQRALKFFDNTCIRTRRIRVELCADLGAETKPRPWSKYTAEKQKLLDLMNEETVNSNKNIKKISKLKEIMGKYKDDPEFKEFLQAHDNKRLLWANDAEIREDESLPSEEDLTNIASNELSERDSHDIAEREGEMVTEKLATKSISDLEYMKSLMTNKNELDVNVTRQPTSNLDLFTIKIHNVPYKVKRKDILKFFKPLKPYSVRLPMKIHGFCYVGFKTEKDMKKAMLKNKSFIKSKQVFFSDFTEKNKITKHKLDNLESKSLTSSNSRSSKWKQQEDSLCNEEDISESGKIFFRNLAYTVNEDDLQKLFEEFGPIAELNLPVDSITRQIKGFGTITYLMPEHAVKAFNLLDGSTFHGRLLHLMPGKSRAKDENDDENDTALTFKQKKALKLKKSAQQSFNWNTLFLGSYAVAEILARKFETTTEKIFDTADGGSNAAVRLALGETQAVIEMKKFLEDNGVQLNVFDGPVTKRSKTTILVKNLPNDTTISDLKPLFNKYGPISRFILPPSGVTAIVEYCDPGEARSAFKKLAYSKYKNVPLYLEWAPDNMLTLDNRPPSTFTEEQNTDTQNIEEVKQKDSKKDQPYEQEEKKEEFEEEEDICPEPNTTLFLRNLDYKTEQETIYNHFKRLGAIHTVEIAKRRNSNKPQNMSSLGYGFIQFKKASAADKALKTMQFTNIDGNQVELKRSDRTLKDQENQVKVQRKKVSLTKYDGTKILVRNIPFQAKTKEIQDIFKAFGELRSVRLPRKMTPGEDTHRGFGFVDFISKSDAKKAFEALSQSTHLYGRRLVLEWASTSDEDITELRKRAAEQSDALENTYKAKRSNRAVFTIDSNPEQQNE